MHILVIDGAWNVPKRIFRPKRRDGGTNEDSCDQIARSARADTSQNFWNEEGAQIERRAQLEVN